MGLRFQHRFHFILKLIKKRRFNSKLIKGNLQIQTFDRRTSLQLANARLQSTVRIRFQGHFGQNLFRSLRFLARNCVFARNTTTSESSKSVLTSNLLTFQTQTLCVSLCGSSQAVINSSTVTVLKLAQQSTNLEARYTLYTQTSVLQKSKIW